MDEKVQKYLVLGGIVVIISLILWISLLVKPATVGSAVLSDFEDTGNNALEILSQLEFINSELSISNKNLESCQLLNDKYLNELTSEKNKTFVCLEENRKLQTDFDRLSQEYEFNISQIISENEGKMSNAELELAKLKIDFKNLQSRYNNTLQNSANNICCKQRVDNSDIDSYRLSNDKIVCGVGEANQIQC